MLLRSGQTVVDLGAAPGGWSQIARQIVGPGGRVLALDILPMDPITGVEFIQGDFREQEPLDRCVELLGGDAVDLVISGHGPNVSGVSAADQPKAIYLCEIALDLAREAL